jgi:hypothetical protein
MTLADDRKHRASASESVTLNTDFVVEQAMEALDTFVAPLRLVVDAVVMSSRPCGTRRYGSYAKLAVERARRRAALSRRIKRFLTRTESKD